MRKNNSASTPFQRAVWDAVSVVGPGQLTTYQAIATAIGRSPRAAQACHNALKAGVVEHGLDLPWYRIVRADGRIYTTPSRSGPVHDARVDRLRQEGIKVDD